MSNSDSDEEFNADDDFKKTMGDEGLSVANNSTNQTDQDQITNQFYNDSLLITKYVFARVSDFMHNYTWKFKDVRKYIVDG